MVYIFILGRNRHSPQMSQIPHQDLKMVSRIIPSAIFRFLSSYLYNDKQDLGFESLATKLVPSDIYVYE